MSKILSISIAAYNLENLIDQCLESLLSIKNVKDLELIITDDGSKDGTLAKLEEWKNEYPSEIVLISQKNSGAGSTVNNGIKYATGKYFRMIDGDDWVDSNNLDTFIDMLRSNESDLIISDYCFYEENLKAKGKMVTFGLDKNISLPFESNYKNLPSEMHAITFKTEIIKNVTLDNGFYTDVEYLLYPIEHVKSIYYFPRVVYIYRIGQAGQSVSPQSRMKHIDDHTLVLNHLLSWYEKKKNNLTKEKRMFISHRLALLADNQLTVYLFYKPSKEYKNKIKQFIKMISTHKDVMRFYKHNKKYKLLKFSFFVLYGFVAKKAKQKERII